MNIMHYADKDIIIFDVDNTLTESKTPMDSDMTELFARLLSVKKAAIITGGSYEQVLKQCVDCLFCSGDMLWPLVLLPTCGARFYRHDGTHWEQVYKNAFTKIERGKIRDAFAHTFEHIRYARPPEVYGDVIEDRETQVTFSALGQQAPNHLKVAWDPDKAIRLKMKKHLDTLLPKCEVNIAGTTSIDITQKGIDKAYGIRQIETRLSIPKEKMLFVGDALFEGGNDYPVKALGVDCVEVSGPEETKSVIKKIINETK